MTLIIFSERYAEETSTQHVINSRGLTYGTPYKRFKRALLAVNTRNGFYTDFDGVLWEKRPNGERVGEGLEASRRTAIAYLFECVYGCPGEGQWNGRGGVLAQVMCRLNIPVGSMACVRKVFADVASAMSKNLSYDPHSGPRDRGICQSYKRLH